MKKINESDVSGLKKYFLVVGSIFLLLMLSVGSVMAGDQQLKISGTVSDAKTGEPLPGVNIVVKGTTIGGSSDFDGKYTIEVRSSSDILLFSFLGYKSEEVAIGNRTIIDFKLTESIQELDEVVAIGYGVQKKRDLTGAITSVNSKSIEDTPIKDVVSVLQGRASGVHVVSNSGAPGDGITISVRGQSTLSSGNTPLYVIDGVPVESNELNTMNGLPGYGDEHGLNPLGDINPQDIESIEVLKDAASTAIYGSRAANGVVLITTKRGKEGKAQINVNAFTGFSQLTHKLSVLNTAQWREIVIEGYRNYDYWAGSQTPSEPSWTVIDSLNPTMNGDVDWQNVMYRTAKQYQFDFSVTGGSELFKYAFSTSYLDQEGIILASKYKRITSRLNTDYQASKRLKIGQSISFAHSANDKINAGGTGNNSVVSHILVRPPVYSLTYPDGSPIDYFFGKRNIVALAEECTHLNTTNRLIGNQYLEYQIIEGLKFRTNVSVDFISMKEDEFYSSAVYNGTDTRGYVRAIDNITWANENFFTYKKTFNDAHNLSALLGYSQQEWKKEVTGMQGDDFIGDYITTMNAAGTISGKEVNRTDEHALVSFFGRVGYDYKSKYFFEATMRADGSSRFGKNKRFGYFPSVSAAWRFTDEPFFEGVKGVLNDGKFRVSWGQTGNEAIGNYVAQGEFSVGYNYLGNTGAAPTVMPNEDLTWETTSQFDIGTDLSFFDNRMTLAADYYKKTTTDMLYAVPIPETTGFDYITQNIGKIENQGMEFSLTTHNFVRKFKWTTNLNLSFNRNKVVDLPDELLTNGFIQNGSYHILKEGESIGIFYGYKALGVYSRDEDNVNQVRKDSETGHLFQGGDMIWDDVNGDNVINDEDKQVIGNAQPDFIGGIINDFSYKNFSLNVFFQFSYGNDIYSDLSSMRNTVYSYNNVSTDALNRWREQGDVTDYPKHTRNDPMRNSYNSRISSRWVEDGSYVKLKSVSLAYNLPSDIVNKLNLGGIRAYITGENLLTWTHYSCYDPDVSSYSGLQIGVDKGSFPQSRTFIFGLNLKF
nr:TonB-dependent receptor [uncultured Draconibacterium sp.]